MCFNKFSKFEYFVYVQGRNQKDIFGECSRSYFFPFSSLHIPCLSLHRAALLLQIQPVDLLMQLNFGLFRAQRTRLVAGDVVFFLWEKI